MNEMTKNIELPLKTVSLDLCIHAIMRGPTKDSFDFSLSIDSSGMIILTPVNTDTEFIFIDRVDDENNIIDKIVCNEGSCEKDFILKLSTTIIDETNNLSLSCDIDSIGQCFICPEDYENKFLTVSINDSLNLITQEEYHGHKIVKNSDVWEVLDEQENKMSQTFKNILEAKIGICKSEISKLEEELSGDQDEASKQETSKEDHDTEPEKSKEENDKKPDVSSEVIEEVSDEDILQEVMKITEDFNEDHGFIKVDTEEEKQLVENILKEHYANIEQLNDDNSNIVLEYYRKM